MNFGERIYKYRSARNLSQGNLADMLDVSRQSVSKWENNSAVPDLDKIIKLCEIFEITIDELVKGEESASDVSSDTLTVESKQTEVKTRQAGFPGRKVAGTILLCMAFLIVLFLALNGALVGGMILATPFIVCGIICFAAKQNAGLWCAWAGYFMIDIYLREMTGMNRGLIFNAYYYTFATTTMMRALLVSWTINLFLLFLISISILRFKNKPIEIDRKKYKYFVIGFIILLLIKVFEIILPTTKFYEEFHIVNHVHYHVIVFMITDWLKIIIFTMLVVNFARYRFKATLIISLGIIILSGIIRVAWNFGVISNLNYQNDNYSNSINQTNYIYDQGLEIVTLLEELVHSDEYIYAFSSSEDILNIIKEIRNGDYSNPQTVYRITLDLDNVLKANEMLNMEQSSEALISNMKSRVLNSIITGINSRSGVTVLAATSVCTIGKTFVCPEIHEEMIYLYTYSDASPVAVTFTLGEDHTVNANGNFLLYDDLSAGSVQELLEYFGAYSVEISVVEN